MFHVWHLSIHLGRTAGDDPPHGSTEGAKSWRQDLATFGEVRNPASRWRAAPCNVAQRPGPPGEHIAGMSVARTSPSPPRAKIAFQKSMRAAIPRWRRLRCGPGGRQLAPQQAEVISRHIVLSANGRPAALWQRCNKDGARPVTFQVTRNVISKRARRHAIHSSRSIRPPDY